MGVGNLGIWYCVPDFLHNTDMSWAKELARAKAVQERLAGRVRVVPLRKGPRTVAGVDAAFSETRVYAAAALFSYPGLELIEYPGT